MDLRTIIIGLFVLLPVTFATDEDEVDAAFKDTITREGVTCVFAEYKKSDGKGPRGLRLYSCKNKKGNMNIDCTYYGGNPHSCKKYKPNQQTSIEKYYKALATSAMDKGNPCRPNSITENICDEEYPCIEGTCMKKQSFVRQDEL